MKRHVILIGLPGAGKTTVGALAAVELGTGFVDLDHVIEREQGMSVSEIFALRGEPGFRELEREAAVRVLAGDPQVVAPGGGWSAQPGALESARSRGFIVYLRTEPGVAARRLTEFRSRPLLGGPDPEARVRELLSAREAFYLRADAAVSTDGRLPKDVGRDVAMLARSQAEW
jgi:shikimate kinase